MQNRVPTCGRSTHVYYKYKAEISKGIEDAQVIKDVVTTFYPTLKAPYQLEAKKEGNIWEVAVKLSIQGKVFPIGAIQFRNFKNEEYCEPSVVFSNDILQEMALKRKSLEETEEKVAREDDFELKAVNFLKKYLRMANSSWYLFEEITRPTVSSVLEHNSNTLFKLRDKSEKILSDTNLAFGVSLCFCLLGGLLLGSLLSAGGALPLIFGTALITGGAVCVALGALGINLVTRIISGQTIEQLLDLDRSVTQLSKEAMSLLEGAEKAEEVIPADPVSEMPIIGFGPTVLSQPRSPLPDPLAGILTPVYAPKNVNPQTAVTPAWFPK